MEDDNSGTVKLVSSDKVDFTVEIKVARLSAVVKGMLEEADDDDDAEIPLPNVKSTALEKVIEFCEHYEKEQPMGEIEKPLKSANMEENVDKWYADFVDVEQALLFDLIFAANYMDVKPLLDLTGAKVASMFKGRTTAEIREAFGIGPNDFTPEEEAMVRDQNTWCEAP